jgi:hypothetical protein
MPIVVSVVQQESLSPFRLHALCTRKNLTSSSKSANKPSTNCVCTRQLPILHVCLTQSFARHIYWQDIDRMCPGVCPQLRGNDYSGSFLNKGGGQTLFCIVLA